MSWKIVEKIVYLVSLYLLVYIIISIIKFYA